MDSQLKRGLLDACVLAVLRRGESYGYKIISDLSEYIDVSESTLYPVLRRLEVCGAVKTRSEEFNGRIRKYYAITQAGKNKINDFIEDMAQFKKIETLILE